MKIMRSSFLGLLFFASHLFRAEEQNELEVFEMNYENDYSNEYQHEQNNDQSNPDVHDKPNHGRSLTVLPPDDRVEYNPIINQRSVGLLSSMNNGTF